MNIAESFATYLQTLGIATLGQDLFIGNAPSSNRVSDSMYWIIESGGSPLSKNSTGELLKSTTIEVYYRDRNYKNVYDKINTLEETISCAGCIQLNGFDIIKLDVVSYPIDQDLDNEDRKIGMLQVNILTYKEC
jgi:hypothetical protein